MKTWFDWMDTYYTPRPQPEGAQEGETERILALARQKLGLAGDAPQAQPGPRPRPAARRIRRLWALAAAAALLFCLGVGTAAAAGVFPWASIGDFFGAGSQQQAASLGMPGEGLSLTQTKEGVTVTLEGVLDDGTTAYLPVQLTFADGQYDPDLRYNIWAILTPRRAGIRRGQLPSAGRPGPHRRHRTADADRPPRGAAAGAMRSSWPCSAFLAMPCTTTAAPRRSGAGSTS